MSKIRRALQLLADSGLSTRQVAAVLGISKSTVSEIALYARTAGIDWPLASSLSDEELQARLYPPPRPRSSHRQEPDYAQLHQELKRPGVTLQLLWGEHRTAHPDGYGYSRFCDLYRAWEGQLSATMRQTHVAGERMFVDYAGTTLEVIDAATGEVLRAQLFVAVLGASNYTYVEATWTQGLADWIGSHVRTFAFFGGVPAQVVSDNIKSGITKACFYEPAVNRTCAEMAAHYDTAIVPARPYRPRDKAKVEVAVLVATRWISPVSASTSGTVCPA
jgi:transposase